MDKNTFELLYGCYGVKPVMRRGVYGINVKEVDRVRRGVLGYYNLTKPGYPDLRQWLAHYTKLLSNRVRRQSIQIGIIHALQDAGQPSNTIFSLLCSIYPDLSRRTTSEDSNARIVAAQQRRLLHQTRQ